MTFILILLRTKFKLNDCVIYKSLTFNGPDGTECSHKSHTRTLTDQMKYIYPNWFTQTLSSFFFGSECATRWRVLSSEERQNRWFHLDSTVTFFSPLKNGLGKQDISRPFFVEWDIWNMFHVVQIYLCKWLHKCGNLESKRQTNKLCLCSQISNADAGRLASRNRSRVRRVSKSSWWMVIC